MKLRSITNPRLAMLLAVGLILRLGVAVMLGLNEPPRPGSDADEYDTYAWNLAQGHGYRGMSPDVIDQDHLTAYRLPGASILWSGLYRVFGHRYNVVRIVHCLLGTIAIIFVYGIGRRCFGESVGLLSAAAFAIWPTSLLYSNELASEPLFTFLFLWYLVASLAFAEQQTLARALGAGLLLGLAIVTLANAIFMVPLAALWACWQFRGQWKSLRAGLLIPVVALSTLIPWAIRNYVVFHEFLPFGTGGGDVLLGGNNRVVATDPVYYGYWVFPTSSLPEYSERLKAPDNEVRRDHLEKELAVQWLKDHPNRWWYLVESKFRRSLTPFLASKSPRAYRLGTLLSWGPVMILSVLSFFPSALHFFRTRHPGWILHLGIIQFELTAIVFWGSSRFRYPVEGLFIVLACVSALWLWDKLRGVNAASA